MVLTRFLAAGEIVRRILRRSLPRSIYSKCADACNVYYGIRRLGWRDYAEFRRVCRNPKGRDPVALKLRTLPHPFYVRVGTSDAEQVVHSILREVYAYRAPSGPVNLIIDAGANVGDTSVWYAARFPTAKIVAIEPDPGNYATLLKNCAPYGERIKAIRAALWPTKGGNLVVVSGGDSCSITVRESSEAGNITCPMIDIPTILAELGAGEIDILKIDIEGTELPLFSRDCDEWLLRTRNMFIETHSDEARDVVLASANRNGFGHAIYRELHVFYRQQ